MGAVILGAGLGTAFLYAALAVFIQVRIIPGKKSGISIRVPVLSVESNERLDISFEIIHPFPVFPGCIASAGIELIWKNRVLSGASPFNGGTRHGTIRITGLRRGVYRSEGAFFEISDAADLFRFRYQCGGPAELTVKPASCFEAGLPRSYDTGGDNLSRIIRKKRSAELIESRQYYPGDDVRRINWKTMAHTGQLFVRIGEELPEPDSHLLIIIDLSGAASCRMQEVELDRYIDLIVENINGIIKKLVEAGINLECAVVPGAPVPVNDITFLSSLWWTDSDYSNRDIFKSRRKGSCLLICPAFSVNAAAICNDAAVAGFCMNVMIPVCEGSRSGDREGPLYRFLLRNHEPKMSPEYAGLRTEAQKLRTGLSGIKGVNSAEII